MIWLKCLDCGSIFKAEDAAFRPSREEDGLPPWVSVDVCPDCGSDELIELGTCELCKERPSRMDSDFCSECCALIDSAFQGAIKTVHSRIGGEYTDVVRLMFDRAEEADFYK